MKKMIVILLGSLGVAGAFTGCAADNRGPETRTEQRTGYRETYNAYVDPVCGGPVNPHTDYYTATYNGRLYRFTHEECWRKFTENPTAYVPSGEHRGEVR